MPTPDLKPCPWGGDAMMQNFLDRSFRVVGNCGKCGRNGECPYCFMWGYAAWLPSIQDAASAWNSREERGGNDGNG